MKTGLKKLDERYTFDNFVVGDSNRFAYQAALAVAKTPGTSCNPLFLYGDVGLGKTHLIQAIANKIIQDNPKAKVLYVTTENFINELLNSIKNVNNKLEQFRNKYRNIYVLLIDDIQFIAGKEIVEEEFFSIFNTLYEDGKQIVISSDRLPRDIPIFDEILKSRFEWGIIAEIIKPNYETRLEILKRKRQLNNIIIDDEILSIIATKVDSNIRVLEEVLNKIVAFASLNHNSITIEITEKVINILLFKI